jgi:hypothetical protein
VVRTHYRFQPITCSPETEVSYSLGANGMLSMVAVENGKVVATREAMPQP